MTDLWQQMLVTPLLNLLVVLTTTVGFGNLGIAVVWLTVLVRILLIPFSFLTERNLAKYAAIDAYWKRLLQDVPTDHVLRRQLLKAYIGKQRVSPWARVALLGVQFLILVLLYQAFIAGFADPAHLPLYGFVARPETITTSFFGLFDIAQTNVALAALVAGALAASIWFEQRVKRSGWTRASAAYLFVLPLATFAILSVLPSVKCVFILTSLAFSLGFHLVQRAWSGTREVPEVVALPYQPTVPGDTPWDTLRSEAVKHS